MTDLKCLTTKEVARLCRVSDATVKRWQEAGLLQSERTSGNHRRFRPEEVARFQRAQGLGLKRCRGDESVLAASTRKRGGKTFSSSTLFQSLTAGCEEAAANVLISAYLEEKSLAEIFDDLICPAMRQIGELWAGGQISITQEHLATRVAHNAIYKLRQTLSVSKNVEKTAMCCALEGDFHELPTHLAQMTIENEGWETINFGANTPLYALTEEILRRKPDLVCISGAVMNDAEHIFRDYQALRLQTAKPKIPFMLGGKVFAAEQMRARFPAEFYAGNFADVAGFVQSLTNQN
ncbi:MAG TPA: B12-binding domain-containing protein [Pyrinomonadaceae bacterium]|nr:B12-binding domain-containing protein [Pyrinomonadaceae bacterium]